MELGHFCLECLLPAWTHTDVDSLPLTHAQHCAVFSPHCRQATVIYSASQFVYPLSSLFCCSVWALCGVSGWWRQVTFAAVRRREDERHVLNSKNCIWLARSVHGHQLLLANDSSCVSERTIEIKVTFGKCFVSVKSWWHICFVM